MTAFQHTRRALPLASLARALCGLSGGLFCLGCSSDGDLATGNLGDTSEPGDPPTATVLDLTDPWWCLGQDPPPLPPPQPGLIVGFVLPALDWPTLAPLAGLGLTATLCPGTDFDCTRPLAAPYAVRDGLLGTTRLPRGAAGIPVVEGFDGLIKFEMSLPPGLPDDEQYIPVSYYLGGTISGDVSQGQAVYMLQRRAWATLLAQSFPELDGQAVEAAGTLIAGVFDCNGNPVNGARVEINVTGGGITPFLIPTSRIPIALPTGSVITGASGLVGYLGVPVRTVQLRVFRRGDTEPFGSTELGVVAGQMSVASLRPAYVRDANLSATSSCCPAALEP